jgi:hypothetical protein
VSVVEGQERLVEVGVGEGGVRVVGVPVAEEKTFRRYDPEQVLLMAPVLSEWVPEGDLAHFVSDLVESGAFGWVQPEPKPMTPYQIDYRGRARQF